MELPLSRRMDHEWVDRRIVFLVVGFSLTLALAVFFGNWSGSSDLLLHGTHWFLLVVGIGWVGLLLRFVKRRSGKWMNYLRSHSIGIVFVLLATAFFHVHEPHSLKNGYSESEMSSIARSQLYYNEHATVSAGYSKDKMTSRVYSEVSYQAPLFPWLLSMIHGVSGYRFENVFVLNFILSATMCGLVYFTISDWMGFRYGVLSLLMLVGFPLLHEAATGGGSEILQVCLFLLVLNLSRSVMESGSDEEGGLLLLTGFLMACNGGQGLLLSVFPFALMAMRKRYCFGWGSKWLFIPVIWLFPALFVLLDSDSWTLSSLERVSSNFSGSFVFLADTTRSFGNSPFLSGVGIVSICFWFVHLFRDRREEQEEIAHEWLMVGFVALVIIGSFGSLFFSEDSWADPVLARDSILLHVALVFLAPYVMRFGFRIKEFPKTLWIIPSFVAIALNGTWGPWGAPTRVKDPESIGVAHLDMALRDHVDSEESLYIGECSLLPILRGWSSLPMQYANRIPERIEILMHIGYFKNIYVGGFYLQGDFGARDEPPNERFILEPIWDGPIRDGLSFRMCRLVGVAAPVAGGDTLAPNLPLPMPSPGASRDKIIEFMSHLLYTHPVDFEKDI